MHPSERTPVYSVTVANVGTVYTGHSLMFARAKYSEWREQARKEGNRAAGQEVTILKNGKPYPADKQPDEQEETQQSNTLAMSATWEAMGTFYIRLIESKEWKALQPLRGEFVRAFATVDAVNSIVSTFTDEQSQAFGKALAEKIERMRKTLNLKD